VKKRRVQRRKRTPRTDALIDIITSFEMIQKNGGLSEYISVNKKGDVFNLFIKQRELYVLVESLYKLFETERNKRKESKNTPLGSRIVALNVAYNERILRKRRADENQMFLYVLEYVSRNYDCGKNIRTMCLYDLGKLFGYPFYLSLGFYRLWVNMRRKEFRDPDHINYISNPVLNKVIEKLGLKEAISGLLVGVKRIGVNEQKQRGIYFKSNIRDEMVLYRLKKEQ